ncbi:MAG: hypothetical protein ACI9DC_000965 [Gammaproteobacteria bacterium]|jgi:hypothetical protein
MNNECPLRSALLRRVIALAALLWSVAAKPPLLAVDAGRFIVVVGDVRVVDENGQTQPAVRGSRFAVRS